ncbi:MAG: hypothetical protein LBC76_02800 [Treponema sp.]|jgi:hypothetical protein|nr:hypothetical protein [Treponema sp.]
MRITAKNIFGQLLLFFFITSLCSCLLKKEENPVIPPETSPLSQDYIGYGVITNSFTHITADPSEESPSLGYLRRGSLVRIIRRQSVKTVNGFISWVLIEDSQYGWLKEEAMDIYSSENQAKTASESMTR